MNIKLNYRALYHEIAAGKSLARALQNMAFGNFSVGESKGLISLLNIFNSFLITFFTNYYLSYKQIYSLKDSTQHLHTDYQEKIYLIIYQLLLRQHTIET